MAIKSESDRAHEEYSKKKLEAELAAKMKTIMIGSLSAIEERFGELWGFKENRQLTKEEEQFEQAWAELRKSILDNGNTQIKNMRTYLSLFNINFEGFNLTIKLPIRRKEDNAEGRI